MTAIRSALTVTLVLGLVVPVLAGCDGGGSKRASQAQRLSGSWEVCVDVGSGGCARERIVLHVSDGEGPKAYRLIRESGAGTTTGRGEIEVVQANTLRMSGEFFSGDLVWDLDFTKPTDISGSARLTLIQIRGRTDAVQDFLGFLGIPSWTGGRIQMDLRLSS